MKTGQVIQFNRKENVAVVKEDGTATEFLVFLDDLTEEQIKEIRVFSSVSFMRDPSFEQFVILDITVVRPVFRKAV